MDWLTMTVVFAALKLTNEISWSWWGVLAPTLIALLFMICGYIKAWLEWHW